LGAAAAVRPRTAAAAAAAERVPEKRAAAHAARGRRVGLKGLRRAEERVGRALRQLEPALQPLVFIFVFLLLVLVVAAAACFLRSQGLFF